MLIINECKTGIDFTFIFFHNRGCFRWHGQVVRQGPAKPLSPVRIWVPPKFYLRALLFDNPFAPTKSDKFCPSLISKSFLNSE